MGAEACNPVTWSSGGQIVPCDTKRKRRALAGLATALALGLGDKQRLVHGLAAGLHSWLLTAPQTWASILAASQH